MNRIKKPIRDKLYQLAIGFIVDNTGQAPPQNNFSLADQFAAITNISHDRARHYIARAHRRLRHYCMKQESPSTNTQNL